ncbi:MAG: response regulator [Lachnospiraceae bacterium]|jgi:two-component system response regulator YesN|nr:response regulator [Lachnospiraceae bacterium]
MKSVIVVDDNQLVREAICKTIHWDALDCVVQGAFSNGQEGFAFAKEYHPDIIITDIKMPLMDGLTMLEELKKEYTGFAFIMITGFGEFEFAQRALRLGAADILLKPIENEELVQIVRRVVSKTGSFASQQIREAEDNALPEMVPVKPYDAAVRRAMEFIRKNLDRKIALPELADYVGLSAAHLSRLIKRNTDKTFVDIVNEMRIDEAIRLLREGKYKVYEVSNMVGIDNYAYFYQLFKKMTGKPPKDFM